MTRRPGNVVDKEGIVHVRRHFKGPTTGCGLVVSLDNLEKTPKQTVTCLACAIQAYGTSNLDA